MTLRMHSAYKQPTIQISNLESVARSNDPPRSGEAL